MSLIVVPCGFSAGSSADSIGGLEGIECKVTILNAPAESEKMGAFSEGQKIQLKVDITNSSDKEAALSDGIGYTRPALFRDKKLIPYRPEIGDRILKDAGAAGNAPLVIMAGRSASEIIDLEKFYGSLKEGSYQVLIERKIPGKESVLSGTTQFEILPADKTKVKLDQNQVSRVAQNADVVVIGKVTDVKPSPGYWNGAKPSVQIVNYKVEKVLKGHPDVENISVGHYVVQSSLSADRNLPQLSSQLFASGEELLLFLKANNNRSRESRDCGYFAVNNDYGTLPATANAQKIVDEVLIANRTQVGSKGLFTTDSRPGTEPSKSKSAAAPSDLKNSYLKLKRYAEINKTVVCRYWQSQVDDNVRVDYEIDEADPASIMQGIGCLLALQGNKMQGAFAGATENYVSQIFPDTTVELCALYYISYVYYQKWNHADGIALFGRDRSLNSDESVVEAYQSYRLWFSKVEEIGLEKARAKDLDPLAKSGAKWY